MAPSIFLHNFHKPLLLPVWASGWRALTQSVKPLERRQHPAWRLKRAILLAYGAVAGAILLFAFYRTSIVLMLVPFLKAHGP